MFSTSAEKRIANVKCLSAKEWNRAEAPLHEMDNLKRYEIANRPWRQFNSACSASFAIAHTDSAILLKYFIIDDVFASQERPVNSEVNRDNCVEFFISFSNGTYYNIEFNCLGIGKVGYGKSRTDRELLEVNVVEEISVAKKLSFKGDLFDWEILLIIPKTVFYHEKINSFAGMSCGANFYKCGDDLPNKDFLVWNNIVSNEPDFHKPEFFGQIVF
jgi:hypothetical protein